jgi:outer membrane protein
VPPQVDDWVSAAEANSAAIEQARIAWDVAKLETEKAWSGHLPTVALTGSYGRTHAAIAGDVYSSLFNNVQRYNASGTGNTGAVGVTVKVPLFSGFAVENRVKETVSLEDKARNDLEGARRGVSQATRTAFFGVQSGQAQVKALEAAESSSKLALEATQLGYKVGVRVNLDVLNAQTQLFQTQRDLAKARYDVIVVGLKLRQASGQLKPDDVAAVNQLLVRE